MDNKSFLKNIYLYVRKIEKVMKIQINLLQKNCK